MTHKLAFSVAALALASAATGAGSPPTPSYHITASIPMSDGGWDLLAFDGDHQRVLVAHGESLSVVDLAAGRSHDIGKLARSHGVVPIPGTALAAVTSGQDDSVRLLNVADGSETAKIAVGKGPDAALWDPNSRDVLVMNAEGGSVSVIDPRSAKVIKTIPVKAALELGAVIAPHTLAVNDEEAGEVELVDLQQGKLTSSIKLTGCDAPTGFAYDAADRLSLSACRNGVSALLDLKSNRVVKLLPIGQGPDGALYDARRKRFLVPCGRSGTLSLFDVRGGQVTPAGTVQTEASARTAALDPATGRVFLPSARFLPAEAGKRPGIAPGSAHLLVLSLS
jgi:YVTN family beta-propeller protein